MTTENMRRAITEPTHLAGLSFETGLQERILQDSGDAPGELPLVQYALNELFECRQGKLLTQQGYDDLGGIKGALAKRADAAYAELNPEQQQINSQNVCAGV